jgi:hypothetical protein
MASQCPHGLPKLMAVYSQSQVAAMPRAVDEAPGPDAKGTRLGDFVNYLFSKIRGVSLLEGTLWMDLGRTSWTSRSGTTSRSQRSLPRFRDPC